MKSIQKYFQIIVWNTQVNKRFINGVTETLQFSTLIRFDLILKKEKKHKKVEKKRKKLATTSADLFRSYMVNCLSVFVFERSLYHGTLTARAYLKYTYIGPINS